MLWTTRSNLGQAFAVYGKSRYPGIMEQTRLQEALARVAVAAERIERMLDADRPNSPDGSSPMIPRGSVAQAISELDDILARLEA